MSPAGNPKDPTAQPPSPFPSCADGPAIRVMVVDDHPVVRRGLVALIKDSPDMEVVAEARDGNEAQVLYARTMPDVVLMDLKMPVMGGVEAITTMKKNDPAVRVIVLTTFDGDEDIARALRAGARGYLLKDEDGERVLAAVRAVAAGGSVIAPELAQKLAENLAAEPPTSREMDVLKLMALGLGNKQIADQLFVSEATVKTHVNNLFAKLGVRGRTEAVHVAVKRGLVSIT